MYNTFSNNSLYKILEAYKRIDEALTIPVNQNDVIERQLYSKLDKNYKYADFIVRYYRNDKKAGVDESTLRQTYISNLKNILDLLKDYDSYIAELQQRKQLKETILLPTANGGTFKMNPIKDFPSIRRLDGVKRLVEYLGNIVHSKSSITTTNGKYAITDADRSNIRLVGFRSNVAVWATRTFDSTNKFVYQLWQNASTMDRGDAYGNKMKQSPYCTHAISHWETYSSGYDDYQQYWYLVKIGDQRTNRPIQYVTGDLNNPAVVNIFNNMKGTGPNTILAMNDTGDDFLDSDDQDFKNFGDLGLLGAEIGRLDKDLFVRVGTTSLKWDRSTQQMETDDAYEDDVEVYLKSDGVVDGSDSLKVVNIRIGDYTLKELPKGLPEEIEGDFDCSGSSRLTSLEGLPKEIGGNLILIGCDGLTYPILSKYIDIKGRALKIVNKFSDVRDLKMDGDKLTFLLPFSDLEEIYDDNRDSVSFETIEKVLTGEGFDIFNNYYGDIYWDDLDTKIFDNKMSEFRIDFEDIKNIFNDKYEYLIENGKMDKWKIENIQKLLQDDFHEGMGLETVHANCMARGAETEAYKDINRQLFENIPIDREYGVQDVVSDKFGLGYKASYIKPFIKVVLDENGMCNLVKNYNPDDCDSILKCFDVDEYGEYKKISINEPQYGWNGWDDEGWKEALTDFTNNVYQIMTTKPPVKDLKGQQHFDFDKDYLDNPSNLPRRR